MLSKNKFQLKREATYQLMLESGLQCFYEKGYTATTIKDIVTRTGHTQGAFYGHFENKEQFFQHVMDYQHQLTSGWGNIPSEYNPSNTTLEQVLTMILEQLLQMLDGKDSWILVLVDFYENTKQDPNNQRLIKAKYDEWVAGIEEMVKGLQAQGWVAANKDTHQIALQLIAFNEGMRVFSVITGDTFRQTLIQGLIKLLS